VPQLVVPGAVVNLRDIGPGIVVVVVGAAVVVVGAAVVVVGAAVVVVGAAVVEVGGAAVVVVGAAVVVVGAAVVVVGAAVVVVGAPVVVVEAALVVVVAPAVVLVVAPAVVDVVAALVVLVVASAVLVVVADGTVVVVLPGGPQVPPAPHASQQLDDEPTHAVPPLGARQAAALRLMLQRVVPSAVVRQQATRPDLPHAERAAQFMTASRHSARSVPASTAALIESATQLT